jgi:dTDP-4-dehydrorhamnose 3,5-epimerase
MMKNNNTTQSKIIHGDFKTDQRGEVTFFNEFDMSFVKRFYVVKHFDNKVVRAWQGHRKERKCFYVLEGAFKIALIKVDNWDNPSLNLEPTIFELSAKSNQVLSIPSGFANGFKALLPNSKMMVFSDMNVQDSIDDTVRYDASLWTCW